MPEEMAGSSLEARIIALERLNEQHTDTHKEIFGRLNALEKENAVQNTRYDAIMDKLDRIDRKYDSFAARLDTIERTVLSQSQTLNELNERGKNNKARLDAIEAKPGKRLDTAITAIITAIVGALIGALAVKFGLS